MVNIVKISEERDKLINTQTKLWKEINRMGQLLPEQFDGRIAKFQQRALELSQKENRERNQAKKMKIAEQRIEAEKIARTLRNRAIKKLEKEKWRLYNRYKVVSRQLKKCELILKKAGRPL